MTWEALFMFRRKGPDEEPPFSIAEENGLPALLVKCVRILFPYMTSSWLCFHTWLLCLVMADVKKHVKNLLGKGWFLLKYLYSCNR